MNRILLQHLVNQAECNSFHEVSLRKDVAVDIVSKIPLLIDTYVFVLTLNVQTEWLKHVGTN